MNFSESLSDNVISDEKSVNKMGQLRTLNAARLAFAFLLTTGIVWLNSVCINILAKTRKLRDHNFLILSTCLCISDLLLGVFSGITSIVSLLNYFDIYVPYICYIIRALIVCTGLYSVFHTLLICVDRLFATFLNVSFWRYLLRRLLSKKLLIVSYTLFVIYGITFFCTSGDLNSAVSCVLNENKTVRMATGINDCILLCFIVTLSVLYIMVIVRMIKLQKEIKPMTGEMRRRRTRRNVILLGLIVGLTCVCLLPRIFVSLATVVKDTLSRQDYILLNVTRMISMFKPVLDPLTYIIMLQKIQGRISTVCCQRFRRSTQQYQIECSHMVNISNDCNSCCG